MKISLISFGLCILLFACTSQEKQVQIVPEKTGITTSSDFFPVTNFIKGQVAEIRNGGINPLKITTIGNHSDSVWLKIEDLENAFENFLSPTIDSAAMWRFFRENKFLDQTLGSYTFTYEPKTELPDSLEIRRWDVYINPKNGTVKRIYIEKTDKLNSQLQLTWQTNEWCKIVSFPENKSGEEGPEKEELIKWKFE